MWIRLVMTLGPALVQSPAARTVDPEAVMQDAERHADTLGEETAEGKVEAPDATPSAVDWPHWRGLERSGCSSETGWLSDGAEEPLWRADVGVGYSSPSIAGGRLYTRGFSEADGVDVTSCLDAETGEEIWTHTAPAKLWDNMHGGGTLTTPTVDGDVVYILSRMGPLTALARDDGRVLWERNLEKEFEVALGSFGLSSSPVVVGERLFVNVGKTLALDKRTGKTIWETRDYTYSYATPQPFDFEGRALLAVFNGKGLAVLDLESGAEVALHPWTSGYNVNSASPIVIGNRIFISTGYNDKGCSMLELTRAGLTPIWSNKRMNNKMNGCVLSDGLLFGFDDAVLRCLNQDGEELWNERGHGKGTVIASDGRLIVLSEDGELLVAPANGEGFAPASRTKVFEEGPCWTTPVLSGGRIYLRNAAGRLACMDHRSKT